MKAHRLILNPYGYEIEAREGETVLQAILRSGFRVFYGCRGGGCGTCKMRLISGVVERGRCSRAVLSEEEEKQGYFLSCQAIPLSDVEIHLVAANRLEKRSGIWHYVSDSEVHHK